MTDEGIEQKKGKKYDLVDLFFNFIWNVFVFKGKTIDCNPTGRQAVFLKQIG